MNLVQHVKSACFSFHAQLWNLFVLDFLVKRAVLHFVTQPVLIGPCLTLELSINRGISWGMFSSHNPWVFGGVTVTVALFLAVFAWYVSLLRKHGVCTFAETLVLVGGTSNFFDRLMYGGVVDFIDVHYAQWWFPVFNLADVWIVTGVFLMLVHMFVTRKSA